MFLHSFLHFQWKVISVWGSKPPPPTPATEAKADGGQQCQQTDLHVVPGATRAALQTEVGSHGQLDGVANLHVDVPHTLRVGWVVRRVVRGRQATLVAVVKTSAG